MILCTESFGSTAGALFVEISLRLRSNILTDPNRILSRCLPTLRKGGAAEREVTVDSHSKEKKSLSDRGLVAEFPSPRKTWNIRRSLTVRLELCCDRDRSEILAEVEPSNGHNTECLGVHTSSASSSINSQSERQSTAFSPTWHRRSDRVAWTSPSRF